MFEKLLARVKAIGDRMISVIRTVFNQFGKNATGQTIQSLRQAVEFQSDDVFSIDIYGSTTFQYIENGRPSGSKLPPEGVLIPWMQARSIPIEKEFAVRKSIAEKGIEPTPIIEISFIQIQREVTQDLAEDILNSLAGTVADLIQANFNFN